MSDYACLPTPLLIVIPHVPGDHDILEKDVVRPGNKRWCKQGSEETHTWRLKSSASCPTYGSCDFCFSSGPVGKRCSKCTHEGVFLVVLYHFHVLDSVTLAELMERGHEVAKANRTHQWRRTPTETFGYDRALLSLQKYHPRRNSKEEITTTLMKVMNWLPQNPNPFENHDITG